jgi:hypothetical protein
MNESISSSDDLKTIRKIMEESSRFLSLSGLSGVFAGLFAISGAFIAWYFILDRGEIQYDEYFRSLSEKGTATLRWQLFLDGIAVLVLSIASALYLSARKASKSGKSLWTPVSRRMLVNLFVPLVTGGLLALILVIKDYPGLVVPSLLIFYGLALASAGRFTYNEIFYLGLLEIFTGLLSVFFPAWGIAFWVFGFGILHVVYGIFMFRKYEL